MTMSGKTVGHIRVGRPLGRGGMGEVYLGTDETLKRKVALKVLREDHRLSESAKARFRREARVLSSLDHPNICRIYDYIVGTEADFLVLELVDGRGLGKRVREGLDKQQKLRIALQIVDALVEAHAAGVVHRDLKPGNVMVTNEGQAKVLDFGLARTADQPAAVEQDATTVPIEPSEDDFSQDSISETAAAATTVAGTVTGSLIGTPTFMSPEQARGEPATTASDMYSYGLLLQALFTEHLPYEKGLAPLILLQRVMTGDTLPVKGVEADVTRLINRLKSMSPASRPTAVETAERLRWIRDKPRRRIRNLAIAGGVLIAAAVGVKYTLDLQHERSLAVEARDTAQRHRAQADELIGFMLGDLRDKLQPLGRLDILDDVGDKALEHFESLAKETLTEEELFRQAEALRQIGEVRIEQGNLEAALGFFEESLAQVEHLAQRDPANGSRQKGLGEAHFWVGYVYWERNDIENAMTHFVAYRSIAEALVEREPDHPEWQQELAYAHSNMASVLEAQGDVQGALDAYRATLEMKQLLVDRDGDNAERQQSLAVTHEDLGLALQSLGQLEEAEGHLGQSIAIRKMLVERDPENTQRLRNLGVSLYMLGKLFELKDDLPNALDQFGADLEIAESLAERDPENSRWQRGVAVSRSHLGYLLAEVDPVEAHRLLTSARRILESLVAKDETNAGWELDLALIDTKTGVTFEAQGRVDEALRSAGRAEQALEALLRKHPDDRRVKRQLAEAYLLEGRCLESRNRLDGAKKAWNRALEATEPLNQGARETGMLRIRAEALLRLGRLEEAEPVVSELRSRGFRKRSFHELCVDKGLKRCGEFRPRDRTQEEEKT